MAKITFLSLGAATLALSLSSSVQAQTGETRVGPAASAPASAVRPVTAKDATVSPPAPINLPPSVPRKLRYVKLKNAPARQVALQLGWLNSGPSYVSTTTDATTSASTGTGERGRLSPEVLRFVPVEAQNAIAFLASDEEARRLTDQIRTLDVTQPKIRVEVRIYEAKTPEDEAALFASSQRGMAQGFLRPVDEALLTERGRLVSSQALDIANSATVDLSTLKELKASDLDWQLQTSSTLDGQFTLLVSRDGQIQRVQNLAPVSSGQLLALSTDRALQSPDEPRQLVVFVATTAAPKSSGK